MSGDPSKSSSVSAEIERLCARVAELESALASNVAGEAVEAGKARARPLASLEAREELLSTAERIAHVGSFAWDLETDAIHWSDELYRILGIPQSAGAPTQQTFFGAIDPRDRERVGAVAARGVETGTAPSVEFRITRPDGTTRQVHMAGQATRDAHGRPIQFVGAIIDITERVEAEADLRKREEVLRLAQRIARVGSFEWNPVSGRTVWSEGLYDICGVPPSEPGTPERYFSLVHPDDRERVISTAASVDPRSPIPPMEYRIVRPDGTVVELYAESYPVFEEDGTPAGFVGTVLDITQRKRLESQLLQSQKMEALGRLAGGVAHDFNNLLTVIGVHVDVMRRKQATGELAEVAHAVERAAELTRQLLAFSRQGVFEKRRVDPAIVVRDALRMVRRIVGDDVDLSFAASTDLGSVEVDASQLEQVLMNLVVNARDAIGEGGHVAVTLTSCDLVEPPNDVEPPLAAGAFVVLGVEDDGVGMDEPVRKRVFEPFFTTKNAGQGTGLGLAMVFGIVGKHGGGIRITSAPGAGTKVQVYLPRFEPVAPPPEYELGATSLRGLGEHVLLVDDNLAILRVLRDVLVEAGYVVHAAADGGSALAMFDAARDSIALIVTDVVMPSIGGVELVRRVRAIRPSLPALYISGFSRDSSVDNDPAARGALLRKPFLPAELLDLVGRMIAVAR